MMARAIQPAVHLLAAGVLLVALVEPAVQAATPRFARLGSFEGTVEVQLDPADSWRPASLNLPLPESARVRTAPAAKVEIEFDDANVFRMWGDGLAELSDYTRLSGGQRITVISLDHGLGYFTGEPGPGDSIHLLAPGAQALVRQGSRIRVQASEGSSEIAIIEGAARFTIPSAEMELRQGQSARVGIPDSTRFSLFREITPLDSDAWSEQLDKDESESPASTLVLDRNGKWIADGDYGTIWQPKPQAGWAPYRQGRWMWFQPVGFTWVADEPWGWRPYHEGRWLQHKTLGWVWVPGAPNSEFSPGDVFWARANAPGGGGQVLWGPLAPGEQWSGAGPPRQFAAFNVTGGGFVSGNREIVPSPAEDLPKDLLKTFVFAAALPSPALPLARLNVAREALRTRMFSALAVTPEVLPPVTQVTPPAPAEQTKPVTVADVEAALPAPARESDPVASDVSSGPIVPGIIVVKSPNKGSSKSTGRAPKNSTAKIPAPTGTSQTYVAAMPPLVLNATGPADTAALYQRWAQEFHDARLNFVASSGGRTLNELWQSKADFITSDGPLNETRMRDRMPILHFPTAVTGAVLIYNVPGLTETLRLTPDVLASIYLGEIRYWNDRRLVALNPRAGLPPAPIILVERSEASAITHLFSDYMAKVSPAWKARVGEGGTTVPWPVAGLVAKGDDGVGAMVQQTQYSVSYVDYAWARRNGIKPAAIRNRAGEFVQPSASSLKDAAASVDVSGDFRVSLVDAPDDNAYPIASFIYVLVPKRVDSFGKLTALSAFLKWMLTDGQKDPEQLGYGALPLKVLASERRQISNLTP